MSSNELKEILGVYATRCEERLGEWLIEDGCPAALAEAMRYCVMDGGKRLRPALVCMTAEMFDGADTELAWRCAIALELIHCYSLVHDDLPAMDDDTLRRGRPTAHVKFGEAMGILVGDALLTRSFGIIAESGDPKSAQLVHVLSKCSGQVGMIAGQVADMELCDVPAGYEGVEYIHLRKTAALLKSACCMGAICGEASDEQYKAVETFAEKLGLAFQLFDDLLDVTATPEELGKTPGKDADSGKRTIIAAVGIEKARALGEQLTSDSIGALDMFGAKAEKLKTLAKLLIERKH